MSSQQSPSSMTPIHTVDEFRAALAEPRVYIHLWVNWANHSRLSQRVVESYLSEWRIRYPDRPVPCFRIDLSDGEGEIWDAVDRWLTAEGEDAGFLMVTGVGPLFWVQSGHVLHHELNPDLRGTAKLIAVSESVWSAS